jgi:hypothetical protein
MIEQGGFARPRYHAPRLDPALERMDGMALTSQHLD